MLSHYHQNGCLIVVSAGIKNELAEATGAPVATAGSNNICNRQRMDNNDYRASIVSHNGDNSKLSVILFLHCYEENP